jgi:hypothetical protein
VTASRFVLVYPPPASCLAASSARAAGAVVVQNAFPQEGECAGAANAHLGEDFVAAAQARSAWAPADYSAGLQADDWAPHGLAQAGCSAPVDWAVLMAQDSIPADYSVQAGQGERCSLVVRPA